MRGRGRMGSKSEIFRLFNSGYAHDRNISIFRRRASRVTGNTLIKPNYASVRQSRDSLHRDRHNMTKKVALDGSVVRLRHECVTLNFDLLTPKSNQFISVPIRTSDEILAKMRQQILEISRKHKTTT